MVPLVPEAKVVPAFATKSPVPENLTQSFSSKSSTFLATCLSFSTPSNKVTTSNSPASFSKSITTIEILLPIIPAYLAVAVNGAMVAVALVPPVSSL